MSERTEYTPGTFNWVDLATSDTEAAKGFYSEVFGWSFEDVPAGDAGVYSLASLREREVAGLFEKGPEQEAVPPHWNCYVAVASVDDTAAKATSLGGTLMVEPFDVMEAGRMAVVQDPGGAVVALWEPRQHPGPAWSTSTAPYAGTSCARARRPSQPNSTPVSSDGPPRKRRCRWVSTPCSRTTATSTAA